VTNRLQLFLPSGVMLVGLLLVSGIREQYAMAPARPMSAIPARFLEYTGTDQIIDKEEQKVAGMSDYSMRYFGTDSTVPRFTVYVGYYDRQVQGKSIHSPKNCLPGAGWDILNSSRIAAPDGTPGATVNRVVLSNKGNRALVYYWYQGRGHTEASEYVVKWNLLRDAAVYGRTEEALVRIVVPLPRASTNYASLDLDPDVQSGDQVARGVAKQLATAVRQVLPPAPAM
jgi:EpsI family protein